MTTAELTDWIKWFLIIFVAAIIAWEKAKKWHYGKSGKDRRSSNPNLETKVTKLCQEFKDHSKYDRERISEINNEIGHLREEVGRIKVSVATMKGRMNSR